MLSLFRFFFYWICEFQVRRIFDVSSSLEKRLDKMVMFNDGRASVLTFQFSLGTVLSNHSAWQVKYHITQWASISAKIPIFQNLRGFMEKSTRASMCNCLPICRSFFSLFHIACLGSILLFLVIAQLCPLIYCIRNLSAVACTHSFFAYENFLQI